MQIQKKLTILILSCLSVIPSFCYAQTEDAEREALARVISELSLINHIIDEAERKKEIYPHHQFKYDTLRSDLNEMVDGIQTHLNRPNRMPKRIAPLTTEYSE